MANQTVNIAASKATFYFLSIFGFFILLGVLSINGGMWQLFLTMWSGEYSDGSPRYPIYTGVAAVDYLIAMPVSFWVPAVTQMPALKLTSVVLYPTLQALATWATIECFRQGEKPAMLRWAPLAIFVWMWFGTGVFMGLYCYYDLVRHFYSRNLQTKIIDTASVPYHYAVSIPAATILAYIWPYILIHFPPAGTTTAQHQTFIALNQFGSVFCYILVAAGANYLSSNHTDNTPRPRHADAPWIKATYALYAVFCVLMHFVAIGWVLQSSDPNVSISEVFLPKFDNMHVTPLGRAKSKSMMMAPEVQFFLQWDFLLAVFVGAIWATRTTEAMYCPRQGGWEPLTSAGLVFAFSIVSLLLNPGAVLSALLYVREDFLREGQGSEQSDGVSVQQKETKRSQKSVAELKGSYRG
ncbi:hypothetical protein DL769_005372 [Monosporascus sp. CRB-8-3]|nr:hypothetical protein DL769_005372 [Monosporascus sp. CRB-8-3]